MQKSSLTQNRLHTPMYRLLILAMLVSQCAYIFAAPAGPPSKVTEAFKIAFPGIDDVKWESIDSHFVARFTEQKSIVRVFFDSLGNLVESEREIPLEELPEKVVQYIKTQDEDAKIYKACKIEKSGPRKVVLYEVVAKVQYSKSKYTISKDGYLTSR